MSNRAMKPVFAGLVGFGAFLVVVASAGFLYSPVFRSANCYGVLPGAGTWASFGAAGAVVAGVLAVVYARGATKVWPLAATLGAMLLISIPLIAMLGHPGIPEEFELLAVCGRQKPAVYLELSFLNMPLLFAGTGLAAGRFVRLASVRWPVLGVVVVSTLVAFAIVYAPN